MNDAGAAIDSVEKSSVYMNETPTRGGVPVKNDQWVTEN
jgi:hypothetical protein